MGYGVSPSRLLEHYKPLLLPGHSQFLLEKLMLILRPPQQQIFLAERNSSVGRRGCTGQFCVYLSIFLFSIDCPVHPFLPTFDMNNFSLLKKSAVGEASRLASAFQGVIG